MHHGVDGFFTVSGGQPGEDIAQIGIGLDVVHFAGAGQAGKAGPVAAPSSWPAKTALRRFIAGLRIGFSTRFESMSTRPSSRMEGDRGASGAA